MSEEAYFEYGKTEIEYLKSKDKVLAAAIDKIGPIKRKVTPDIFIALINSIVGQQISTKAHITIWGRIHERFKPITPKRILAIPDEELQSCGISFRKVSYIKGIAREVVDGSLDLDKLKAQSDEDVSKRLVQIKGIGIWTAEMLMIFSMQRPNVMSIDDLAIIRGLRTLYHHRVITPKLFGKYKRRYAPYATVASLYLWAIAGGALDEVDCNEMLR